MPPIREDETSALLLAVGGLLHQEIAIEHLLDRLVDRIRLAMEADRGTIYLVDPGTHELVSKAAHLPELDEIRLAKGQGIAGYVAATGEVVNVPTTTTEARFFPGVDGRTGYRTESVLATPMRDHRGAIIGVLQLLNKQGGAFPREDQRVLQAFADQVAIAIEATTLYRDLASTPASSSQPLPMSAQFNRIVGESSALRSACRLTAKVAATDTTVLIRGESGTGKELFARAIHVNSRRADSPFVKVDCAALPPTLIENELFGHERGAYTGADDRAPGKLDAAHGGTLFLDEIGELPLSVQGKLLGVLQDREFQRVGGHSPVKTDVRVVAATNRDLEKMLEERRFRADLYYRIRVVELSLPPLRERGAVDIERLAHHFAVSSARKLGRETPGLAPEALDRLSEYGWPGNVRELENCIESALVVMDGERIEATDLPLPAGAERRQSAGVREICREDRRLDRVDDASTLEQARDTDASEETEDTSSTKEAVSTSGPERIEGSRSMRRDLVDAGAGFGQSIQSFSTLEEIERDHVRRALERARNNQSEAAKLLGISRNTLARKLKQFGT